MENTTTGKRIAKLREQKKLAEHLGISSPAVVAYEHDRSRPVRYLTQKRKKVYPHNKMKSTPHRHVRCFEKGDKK